MISIVVKQQKMNDDVKKIILNVTNRLRFSRVEMCAV